MSDFVIRITATKQELTVLADRIIETVRQEYPQHLPSKSEEYQQHDDETMYSQYISFLKPLYLIGGVIDTTALLSYCNLERGRSKYEVSKKFQCKFDTASDTLDRLLAEGYLKRWLEGSRKTGRWVYQTVKMHNVISLDEYESVEDVDE